MFKKQLKRMWRNRLVKSVLVVISGTAGAQAISMVFIPFITRIYGPEVYGILGAFIALTGVLTTLAALAYPVAIVLPKSDRTATALVKLSLLISATISLAVLGVLWLAGEWLMPKLGASNLIEFMFFIPLVMFLTACQDVAQQWLIRKKDFKNIANISIACSFINNGSKALVGMFSPLAGILIGAHALAIGIRMAFTGYIGKKIASIPNGEDQDNISLKRVACEYRDFPLYRAPQVVLNAASQSLPVLMLAAFFGPAHAGYYALTRTALGLPATLLGSSVQSVFYPHLNEAVLAKNKTLPLLIKSTVALASIGLWPFLIVIMFGPFLFEFVFGQEWQQAGQYAQWMSIWLFFFLISRPVISSIPVFRMQRWFLAYEVFSSFLRVVSIYYGFIYSTDALVSIAVYSVVSSLIYIYLAIKFFFVAREFDREQVSNYA
ncbi:lipopolysaccharide biosynthesis protein [Oceanisphaera arctica]|uniref:Polysaccharide biosynthesis protein n=1 Tax=Oceanisphaera arctica TaxID=641510 RepID=A0A2P5TIX1_9GAMM|nr:oligosaccharide flippase family protein [Oceanisphaera arctica]PPL14811.1 hypothetical protein UN63_14650 [Oceanisphaera arctica]GHA22931.1 hypothetical protein GCM10007082_24530 [Oceanisphaera arctica]